MISIDLEIREKLPLLRLGLLSGNISSSGRFDVLNEIKTNVDVDKLDPKNAINQDSRSAYKILGKEPSRYRPSAEALIRRVQMEKPLYVVNNLVDIINYTSLTTGFSIGLFNKQKIVGPIILRRGDQSPYYAIGRGLYNVQNLPCLYDDLGPFGNPSSDSERTKITSDTTEILMVVYDFGSNKILSKTLDRAESLLKKYCKLDYKVKMIC
jgi:DNA/RNA-binding domain of Phe-tRNA-synthetase-like protein